MCHLSARWRPGRHRVRTLIRLDRRAGVAVVGAARPAHAEALAAAVAGADAEDAARGRGEPAQPGPLLRALAPDLERDLDRFGLGPDAAPQHVALAVALR